MTAVVSDEQPPCEHLLALKGYLIEQAIEIYCEHGERPPSAVHVYCARCTRTYIAELQEPWDDATVYEW